MQVFLFYPGDWSDQSQAFLSSFSSVTGGLGREDCLVYGVSSDTASSHQDWLSSANLNPPFPLISDTAGLLATKFGLYSPPEEEGEDQVEAERPPCRCVVITDNQAVMLELVNTSLTEEELLTYTQERLDMLLQKRRMAVDRARTRGRLEVVDQSLALQRKLGESGPANCLSLSVDLQEISAPPPSVSPVSQAGGTDTGQSQDQGPWPGVSPDQT